MRTLGHLWKPGYEIAAVQAKARYNRDSSSCCALVSYETMNLWTPEEAMAAFQARYRDNPRAYYDCPHLPVLAQEFSDVTYESYGDNESDNIHFVLRTLTSETAIAFDDFLRQFIGEEGRDNEEIVTLHNLSPKSRFLLHTLARRYQLKHKTLVTPDKPRELYHCTVLGQKFTRVKTRFDMEVSNPNMGTTFEMLQQKKSLRELYGRKPVSVKIMREQSPPTTPAIVASSPSNQDTLPTLPSVCLEHVFTFLTFDDAVNGTFVDWSWNRTLNSNTTMLWQEYFSSWLSIQTSSNAVVPKHQARSKEFWNDFDCWRGNRQDTANQDGLWKMYYMEWLQKRNTEETKHADFWKRHCRHVMACCTRPSCCLSSQSGCHAFTHSHGILPPIVLPPPCNHQLPTIQTNDDDSDDTLEMAALNAVFQKVVLAIDDTFDLASIASCFHKEGSWYHVPSSCLHTVSKYSGQPIPKSQHEVAVAIVHEIKTNHPYLNDASIEMCVNSCDVQSLYVRFRCGTGLLKHFSRLK